MGRFIFNAIAAISLGLLVTVLLLRVCGQFGFDNFNWRWGGTEYALDAGREGLTFDLCRPRPVVWPKTMIEEPVLDIGPVRTTVRVPAPRLKGFEFPGFRYEWGPAMTGTLIFGGQPPITTFLDESEPGFGTFIGWWLLALTSAIFPLLWVVRRWQGKQKAAPGFCVDCGYDLRATRERCPECGVVDSQKGAR